MSTHGNAKGASILSLFRSGMDTLDIAQKLKIGEAVVLRRLTIERSRDMKKPVAFRDVHGRVRIHAMDRPQAEAFKAIIGNVSSTRALLDAS